MNHYVRCIGYGTLLSAVYLGGCGAVSAGPYLEPGISADRGDLRAWGVQVADYSPAYGAEKNGLKINALGPADGSTVSLGDMSQIDLSLGHSPGSITLQFDQGIRNGPGWDFAVFENAFSITGDTLFAELGYVEVSTDGKSFARFESVSLTEFRRNLPTPVFSGIDPTNVANLAGKHPSGFGTPFDLDDLKSNLTALTSGVQLQDIRFVRIVDIPGSPSFREPLLNESGAVAFPDTHGNPILDPWNTGQTGVAGFDLDAIGARYVRDESYIQLIRENMFRHDTNVWTGDLNADGITDVSDFNLWNSVDFVDPRTIALAVPEPSSELLLACFAFATGLVRVARTCRVRVNRG